MKVEASLIVGLVVEARGVVIPPSVGGHMGYDGDVTLHRASKLVEQSRVSVGSSQGRESGSRHTPRTMRGWCVMLPRGSDIPPLDRPEDGTDHVGAVCEEDMGSAGGGIRLAGGSKSRSSA